MNDAERLARAVLMFHQSREWTPQARAAWQALTGSEDATTRTLCDLARETLEKAGIPAPRREA
jgi:hypothetical protein